jgi:hypothetical protein
MRGIRLYAIVAAAFMAGAFLASPELRVYAANTVFSTDIKDGEVKTADLANNAVTSAKIKDGEVKTDDIAPSAVGSLRIKDNDVKAQDLAPDSVGGSEMQGVKKLVFVKCTVTDSIPVPAGTLRLEQCADSGVAGGDTAIGTKSDAGCFVIERAYGISGKVNFELRNICPVQALFGTSDLAAIVFSK